MKNISREILALLAILFAGLAIVGWYLSLKSNLYLRHENNVLRDNANMANAQNDFLVHQSQFLHAQNGQIRVENNILQEQLANTIQPDTRNPIGF